LLEGVEFGRFCRPPFASAFQPLESGARLRVFAAGRFSTMSRNRGVRGMLKQELVEILACPENHSRLKLADSQLLQRLNAAIARGELKNKAGQVVATALGGGLVRVDGMVVYPIIDEIPMMLVDQAIPLDQLP
jgi:uncharacterized protein YbaR (Trm112 family)